jgi:signal transduction histidine kinase
MLLLVPTLVLSWRNGNVAEDPYYSAAVATLIVGYTTVGAVIASRAPRNRIGWLLMMVGVGFLLGGFSSEYLEYGYVTRPGSVPVASGLALLPNAFWLPTFVAAILLALLFPTGRVQSPRWRLVPRVIVALAAVGFVIGFLHPGPLELDFEGVRIVNPIGLEGLGPFLDVIASLAWIGFLFCGGVLSIVSVILRYRRSEGEERQQLRWLAAVVAAIGIVIALSMVLGAVVEDFGDTVVGHALFIAGFALAGIGVPVAVGIAVLNYRLYDLDLVVKKAVVFAVVAGTITILAVVLLVAIPVTVFGSGLTGWERGLLFVGIVLGTTVGPLRRWARRVADRLVYGRRATPYEVLTAFSERVGETYATEDVLPRMARVLAEGTGAEVAQVLLRVDADLREVAAWPPDRDPGSGRFLFPVVHQGEDLGGLAVTMPASDPMNVAKERLIRDLAAQAGPVLRNVRLIEELRTSRQRLVAAQDQERRRIERNIHDGAQQQLVALSVKLRLADSLVGKDDERAHAMLTDLQSEAGATLEDLRDLARGIYPPLLADKGLPTALEAQARRSPVPTSVEATDVGRYSQEVESAVYFCALEALNNVAKYSQASTAVVRLAQSNGALSFEVIDDGLGFDPETAGRGTGLRGMADRIDAVGGQLRVDSRPDEGTSVVGRIPVGGVA